MSTIIPAFTVSLTGKELLEILIKKLVDEKNFILTTHNISGVEKFLEIIKQKDNDFSLMLSLTKRDSDKSAEVYRTDKFNIVYQKKALLKLLVEHTAKEELKKSVVNLDFSIKNLQFKDSNLLAKQKQDDEVIGFTFSLIENWTETDK